MSSATDSSKVPFLLVAEADADLADAMQQFLTRDDRYRVRMVDSEADALAALESGGVDLMVTAIDLADSDALELVSRALRYDRDLPIIVLSHLEGVPAAGQCVKRGAYAYLTRPVDPTEFGATIEQGLRWRAEAQAAGHSGTEAAGADSAVHVRREMEQTLIGTLEVMMATVEAKDASLVGHSQRVSALAATVADEMGLTDEEVEEVRLAGRFHDIGKIGIPDELLGKRESPTPEELATVRRHAALGADILAGISHLGRVSDYVRSHHEHWDGTGYPDGLAGTDIPLGARILCAVEVYDALTTAGKDRPALNPIDAVRRMMGLEGKVLDPQVLVALAEVVASQRNLPFLVQPEQRLNASGIVMLPT